MAEKKDLANSMNAKKPDGLKPDGTAYRILVVDDSMVMRKLIIQILRSESFEICGEAATGAEGVTKYKELSPDIITLDVNMPEMNGMEALDKILEFDADATVVMLTSEGQKATVLEAISKGAKNFIVKPPERYSVLEKIKAALKK